MSIDMFARRRSDFGNDNPTGSLKSELKFTKVAALRYHRSMDPIARLKILASLASLMTVAVLSFQACGGDSSTSDAGPDGTTSDAAGDVMMASDTSNDVVQSNDGGCPTYNGSVEFCQAAVARCNACGSSAVNLTSCEVTNLNAVCTWANGLFSTQYQAAMQACETVCDKDAETACAKAELADASLSTAQQKTVTDYCTRCGQSAGCAAQFASQLNIIEYTDMIAMEIDNCTPDAGGPDSGGCGLGYESCAFGVLLNALKGDPCADAGGD
jgi:hypothetical protein